MRYPEDLKYTKDHEWIRLEGNQAVIGVTDFAQSELGEIVFVDVTTVDESVEKGAPFGTIEAVKTVSDMMMPLSGKVCEVNAELNDHPELVNEDPYCAGWIIKATISEPSDINSLLSAEDYKKWIGK